MSAGAVALIKELESQGFHFKWGARGPSLAGDLGKLTPERLEALRPHARELKALTLWRRLQDLSESKYGQPCARLYPFLADPPQEFWKAPVVRTPLGLAHLVQVLPAFCRIAKASEVRTWRKALREQGKLLFEGVAHSVGIDEVWPPAAPPAEHLLEAWQ